MLHLAIMKGESIEKIFAGEKRIEGRISRRRIAPYGLIQKGDKVLVKKPGKKVQGQFEVLRVMFWEHPQLEEIAMLRKKYGASLGLNDNFWQEKGSNSYLTLIFIGNVSPFLVPPQIAKKDLRGWVVLG